MHFGKLYAFSCITSYIISLFFSTHFIVYIFNYKNVSLLIFYFSVQNKNNKLYKFQI